MAYRQYGAEWDRRLVLLHGGRAHGGWWYAAAERLARDWNVLIPDLSGYGNSGRRDSYGAHVWANDVAALIEETGGGPANIAGHSMGGRVGLCVGAQYPRSVQSVICVDSRLPFPTDVDVGGGEGEVRRPLRVYDSQEEAVARFRLSPPPTSADPALLRSLAIQSVRRTSNGWTWKFDPKTIQRLDDAAVDAAIGEIDRPVAVIFGNGSTVFDPKGLYALERRLGHRVPARGIRNSYHHVPLDQPALCASAITELLRELEPH